MLPIKLIIRHNRINDDFSENKPLLSLNLFNMSKSLAKRFGLLNLKWN